MHVTHRAQGGSKFKHPTLRVHPSTSIDLDVFDPLRACITGAGVGLCFHGQLFHAGVPITNGIRYVLVASFQAEDDLTNPEAWLVSCRKPF